MRQPLLPGRKPVYAILLAISISFVASAQNRHIDWATDTVSKADAIAGRSTYLNVVRGSGQLATEQIKLPVDKMKDIFDACAAQNITEISVMIVATRQSDIARLRKTNPEITSTGTTLKGRQMLVFRVPRRAFYGAAGSKVSISNSPLMVSLLGMGLAMLDSSILDLTATGDDIYFSVGTICPPPASCDL